MKKIAILVDAENVLHPSVIVPIVRSAQASGQISALILFGNWNNPALACWKSASITAQLEKWGAVWSAVPSARPGKNAADIALTFEAASLVKDGKATDIWLVSGDSDFTSMVEKLRGGGVKVVVFGPKNTVKALREACTSFVLIDDVEQAARRDSRPPRYPSPGRFPAHRVQATVSQIAQKLTPDNRGWFHGFVRSVGRTYGFIQVNETDSLMFHAGVLDRPVQMVDLRHGDYVEFHIGANHQGPIATNVRKFCSPKNN